DLDDALAANLAHVADGDRAALRPQALALARRAGLVAEVAQVVLAHALGGGLLDTAHEHRDDALEARPVGAAPSALAPLGAPRLLARAVEHHLPRFLGQVLPGLVERDVERLGERLDHAEGP